MSHRANNRIKPKPLDYEAVIACVHARALLPEGEGFSAEFLKLLEEHKPFPLFSEYQPTNQEK